MTKTAVLSDIHGNLLGLKAVIADAEARGCTAFWNLGDILSGPLWPAETADFLMPLAWPTIAGNHERQVLTDPDHSIGSADRFTRDACSEAQLDWLAGLPQEMAFGEVWCTHARPGNDHEYLLESVDPDGLREATDAEVSERLGDAHHAIILHGHSHLPKIRELATVQTVANPGSAGLPAYSDNRPYDHVVETGSPDVWYLVLEGSEIELVRVAYDHEAAAQQAEANGSANWAHYLRTGRVP